MIFVVKWSWYIYVSRNPIPFFSVVPQEATLLQQVQEDERRDEMTDASAVLEGTGDGVIAVLPEAMFNRTMLGRLSSTGLLGGVLVLEDDRGADHLASSISTAAEGGRLYSPDVSTPQVWDESFCFVVCTGLLEQQAVICCVMVR